MASLMAQVLPLVAVAVSASPDGGVGEAVLHAALADAESNEPTRHAQLLKDLETPSFLSKLDSEADYVQASKLRLHVGQVVDVLAGNPAPSAQSAFLELTRNRSFLAHDERVIALILASSKLRPAPPTLVRFWDERSHPDDGFTPTTVEALVDNGSVPALALLEKKMVDPSHRDEEKIAWMRSDILSHRNDLPLLRSCERLLRGKLPKNLRPLLVEVLFDYRPGEWFRPDTGHSAPRIESASSGARAQLLRIAELALKTAALSSTQRSAVTLRVHDIETLKDAGGR